MAVRKIEKNDTSKPCRTSPCVITKASIFVQAKCVVNSEAYCPGEMKFHDNSKDSINCRALVQAEWWGGVKSSGPLIKKKQSSSLSLQHNGILDGCLCLLMLTHIQVHMCRARYEPFTDISASLFMFVDMRRYDNFYFIWTVLRILSGAFTVSNQCVKCVLQS